MYSFVCFCEFYLLQETRIYFSEILFFRNNIQREKCFLFHLSFIVVDLFELVIRRKENEQKCRFFFGFKLNDDLRTKKNRSKETISNTIFRKNIYFEKKEMKRKEDKLKLIFQLKKKKLRLLNDIYSVSLLQINYYEIVFVVVVFF